MPKVSIIVPIYNSRDYISACLDSLFEQTLEDIEIVLVDDHGKDDSLEIIQAYLGVCEKADNVVLTQTADGKGPGAARNTGIACASGEYVAFLDSDDVIDPTFCEDLYNAAKEFDADMAFCHLSMDFAGGEVSIKRNPDVESGVFDSKKKKRYLRRYTSYFTTYIYRRGMLVGNGITFPSTRSSEDTCFLACSLLCANSIASVDKPMYHYMIYQDSVSKKKDRKRYSNRLASFKHLNDFAKAKGFDREYGCILRYLTFKKGKLLALIDYLKNNL